MKDYVSFIIRSKITENNMKLHEYIWEYLAIEYIICIKWQKCDNQPLYISSEQQKKNSFMPENRGIKCMNNDYTYPLRIIKESRLCLYRKKFTLS